MVESLTQAIGFDLSVRDARDDVVEHACHNYTLRGLYMMMLQMPVAAAELASLHSHLAACAYGAGS